MAFGMDIDGQDIERVIQWWPASTLEQYVQEFGKGGRNGNEAKALIYVWRQNRFLDEDVKAFCLNGNYVGVHYYIRTSYLLPLFHLII